MLSEPNPLKSDDSYLGRRIMSSLQEELDESKRILELLEERVRTAGEDYKLFVKLLEEFEK